LEFTGVLGDLSMAIAKLKRSWMVLFCVPLIFLTLPSWGQSSVATLEQQLQTSVNKKHWSQALQIVDRLIPLVPQQARQLKQYRVQIEQLSRNSISSPGQSQVKSLPQGLVSIKRREHGVPVVDVVFNRRKTFEMLVDSGASLTVITRPMAAALGLNSPEKVVQIITTKTANGETKMPIVYVSAITVGGLTTTQVPIAIAGPDLDIGLLGQDFLQQYDVSLKSNRIEFHDRH
jgi:aspartyl protease family protein